MHKYAVYGNEKETPLQVAKRHGLKLDECILCPDGKKEAEGCTVVNPRLIVVGPDEIEEPLFV